MNVTVGLASKTLPAVSVARAWIVYCPSAGKFAIEKAFDQLVVPDAVWNGVSVALSKLSPSQ